MPMSSTPVKLGIVGLGRWAKVLARAGKHRDKLMREAAGAHQRLHLDERDPRLKVIV